MKTHVSSRRAGFTLVELLTVMAIIAILVGLVLGTAGFAQKAAARKQAATEIKAFEAALEGFKADNGIYPQTSATDSLDAQNDTNPTAYSNANLVLYRALTGDYDLNRQLDSNDGNLQLDGSAVTPAPTSPSAPKQYMQIKPDMLTPGGGTNTVTGLIDPFGILYGYSTANQADAAKGYNPTFDLWSTTGSSNPVKWVTNW